MLAHSVRQGSLRPAHVTTSAVAGEPIHDARGTEEGDLVFERAEADADAARSVDEPRFHGWVGQTSDCTNLALEARAECIARERDTKKSGLLLWAVSNLRGGLMTSVPVYEIVRVAIGKNSCSKESLL